MIERLFTIGVYGKTEEEFFRALTTARIDTFCDIRRRRGMRGSQYAFANAAYLQKMLAASGIAYRHSKNLAPSKELREVQSALDAKDRVQKRKRQELGEDFKRKYAEETLAGFDSRRFAEDLGPGASRVALFCVEANPAACHRSLLAEHLGKDWGVTVEHL